MAKILIISATSGNNLVLGIKLQSFLTELGVESDLVNLEEISLPLYTPSVDGPCDRINALANKFSSASGFLFCAPEYNGSVPPVLSNAITWISVKSKNWRDVFNGKFAVIGTHSGGDGYGFLTAFRSQLEYMGTNVLARTISITKEKPLNEDSVKRILQGLVDLV